MLDEPLTSSSEATILARTYFMGLLEAEERPTVANRVRERIRADLARLEELKAQVPTFIVPEGLEDVAEYQLATLQYGLASGRTALAWADEHLP
ncbi:hypothetical protein GOARA_062_00690 [Gordonia araii NBRC 100433]|uniref:Transcription regulator PadR C-terminal domain-containing protein n=1 Tax=Gordonia araii NBRC 100433 TaxID=1073574 RepID=G7H4M6_9ACTN|nr:hypothetical protein [Gordonia araii]NNG96142.1 hypothetical protein [Gordonia araii NBRC 100433]GAB10801.1 hypothetical protein GOARA_062_00690 [Gordonia araii NBRC 100433]